MKERLDEILLSKEVVKDFYKSYDQEGFHSWLLEILPEVEECKNLKQDNPWHIYHCLDHILHSVEAINRQSVQLDQETRRMLAYTMFLHDIGKPQCYLRRYSKLYKREVDSFFNHNVAGVKIADRVLSSFGFGQEEKEQIKKLIDMHDIFMFVTLTNDGNAHHRVLDEEYLKQQIDQLDQVGDGKVLMQYLLLVGRADNLAQNPAMTKKSLEKIDVMAAMLDNLCLEPSASTLEERN